MKYKKELVCMIIYFIFCFTPLFALQIKNSAFSKILPGTTAGTQVFFIFLYISILPLIFSTLLGVVFAIAYLFLHKHFVGRKMIYGIIERDAPKKSKVIMRGVFPALATLNFALIFTPYLQEVILLESVFIDRPGQVYFLTFAILCIFTAAPSAGLFSGAWFLNDAGIGYSNKEKVRDTGEFIEFRSVGGWFHQFLKGYAGIGVIFSFYEIISVFLNSAVGTVSANIFDLIMLLVIVIPLPLYGTLAMIPTLIFNDLLREKRIKFMRNQAKRMGITEELQYTID
ncbi:MAG: hypothetical protein ACTSRI_18795 [Promethearchaeota archaeon]